MTPDIDFCMGPLWWCFGIDVYSLSSASEVSTAYLFINSQSLARDISQTNNKPNCNKNSSIYTWIFTCLHLYIYLRTLHAHLHTTPADTVYTPHTDEWLRASKRFPESLNENIIFFFFAFLWSLTFFGGFSALFYFYFFVFFCKIAALCWVLNETIFSLIQRKDVINLKCAHRSSGNLFTCF